MIRLITIDDDDFQPVVAPDGRGSYLRVVLNRRSSRREMVITPHWHETFISIELLKLAIYCREHDIRLVSVGTMNQLPFFSLFSDEVIVRATPLDTLFTAESSFGFDPGPWTAAPGFVDVHAADLSRGLALDRISIDAVTLAFSHPTVHVRASTVAVFDRLGWPEDRISCEVKRHFFPRVLAALEAARDERIIGMDKSFQRATIAEVGDHFMGLQLLACLYRGWRFIAAGGAVNLFNVLPVHPLLFIETQSDFNLEFQEIARRLCRARYGTHPFFASFSGRIGYERGVGDDDTVTETVVRQALAAASVTVPRPEVVVSTLEGARRAAERRRGADLVGHRFVYARDGYPDANVSLAAGGRIVGGPGYYEHAWLVDGDDLVFLSSDGVQRVRARPADHGGFVGRFVNSGLKANVRLVSREPEPA